MLWTLERLPLHRSKGTDRLGYLHSQPLWTILWAPWTLSSAAHRCNPTLSVTSLPSINMYVCVLSYLKGVDLDEVNMTAIAWRSTRSGLTTVQYHRLPRSGFASRLHILFTFYTCFNVCMCVYRKMTGPAPWTCSLESATHRCHPTLPSPYSFLSYRYVFISALDISLLTIFFSSRKS
jgi:hypothetical protein